VFPDKGLITLSFDETSAAGDAVRQVVSAVGGGSSCKSSDLELVLNTASGATRPLLERESPLAVLQEGGPTATYVLRRQTSSTPGSAPRAQPEELLQQIKRIQRSRAQLLLQMRDGSFSQTQLATPSTKASVGSPSKELSPGHEFAALVESHAMQQNIISAQFQEVEQATAMAVSMSHIQNALRAQTARADMLQ
jgi:hypothetical protein